MDSSAFFPLLLCSFFYGDVEKYKHLLGNLIFIMLPLNSSNYRVNSKPQFDQSFQQYGKICCIFFFQPSNKLLNMMFFSPLIKGQRFISLWVFEVSASSSENESETIINSRRGLRVRFGSRCERDMRNSAATASRATCFYSGTLLTATSCRGGWANQHPESGILGLTFLTFTAL